MKILAVLFFFVTYGYILMSHKPYHERKKEERKLTTLPDSKIRNPSSIPTPIIETENRPAVDEQFVQERDIDDLSLAGSNPQLDELLASVKVDEEQIEWEFNLLASEKAYSEEELESLRFDLRANQLLEKQRAVINDYNGSDVEERLLDYQGL